MGKMSVKEAMSVPCHDSGLNSPLPHFCLFTVLLARRDTKQGILGQILQMACCNIL